MNISTAANMWFRKWLMKEADENQEHDASSAGFGNLPVVSDNWNQKENTFTGARV